MTEPLPSIPIEIVRLPPEAWELYRAIRLEALADSPQAFGSSYQDQVAFPPEQWQSRLRPTQPPSWLLFARAGERVVGMIGAFGDADDPALAAVISVYVSPSARGQGVSRLLMTAILTELKAAGFQKARLTVTASQTAAHHLYLSFGFVEYAREDNRLGDGLIHTEILMEKAL